MDSRRVHSILHHHEARPDARGVFVDHDQSIALYINEAKNGGIPPENGQSIGKIRETDDNSTIVHGNIPPAYPMFQCILFNKWGRLKMDLAEFRKHIPRWDPHQDIHKLRDPFMLNVVYTSDGISN